MKRLLAKEAGALALVEADPHDLAAVVEASEWIWLDVAGREPDIVHEVADLFGIDELAVEDIFDVELLPKVDDHGHHLFVVVHGLTTTEGGSRVDTVEIDVLIGDHFIVTFHEYPTNGVQWLFEAAQSHEALSTGGPSLLFAHLCDVIGRRYLPLLDEIELYADDLGEAALRADQAVLGDILALRRDLSTVRRVLRPQLEVVRSLRNPTTALLGDAARRRIVDVYDLYYALSETAITARTTLSDTLDSYRGAVAENMTQVSKVLTIYAALVLPMSLLAGIYGMNFDTMPGLGQPWGFAAVISTMVAFGVASWLAFVRSGFVRGISLRRAPAQLGRGLSHVVTAPVRASAMMISIGKAATQQTPIRRKAPPQKG